MLLEQELPASIERRLAAQLRKASLAKGMDDALDGKGTRRRRRRRRSGTAKCEKSEVGAMAGGAGAVAGGILTCIFTFIGCFTASPFMVTAGTAAVTSGACNCWANDDAGKMGCALR